MNWKRSIDVHGFSFVAFVIWKWEWVDECNDFGTVQIRSMVRKKEIVVRYYKSDVTCLFLGSPGGGGESGTSHSRDSNQIVNMKMKQQVMVMENRGIRRTT